MNEPDLIRQFLANRDLLFGYLLTLVRSREVAEEVFQEMGISIVSEAAKGTCPGQFLPWARSLARHRVADFYRREARHRHVVNDDLLAEAIDLAFAENEARLRTDLRLQFLEECLARLSERARRLVDLRYRGRAIQQIAAEVGWSEGSIKSALVKARRALGECIGRKLRLSGELES